MDDVDFSYLVSLVGALSQKYTDESIKIAFMGYPDVVVSEASLKGILSEDSMAVLVNRDNAASVMKNHFSQGVTLVPTIESTLHALQIHFGISHAIEATVFDFQHYTGTEKIHDFNLPIDPSEYNTYHMVWNGGTLEHIFDIATALKNMTIIAKEGGMIYHAGPFNMPNHGFYNLCPVLFDNFYANNAGRVLICELWPMQPPYEAIKIEKLGHRFRATLDREFAIRAVIQKEKHLTDLKNPVQGRYEQSERWV